MMKLPLDEFLSQKQDTKILFLGREELFTHQESQKFLKKYNIELTTKLDNSVVGVVAHHRLNPVEEEISCEAYDRKIPLYKLEDFERLLSHSMEDDQILMSLKLSNDQKRLHTLISNEHISDTFFIKLIEMYTWSKNEEEDKNEDRGVVIATLRRFLDYKPNEEDLLYSPLSLKKLIGESQDPHLLKALLSFPNYKFMQKGKKWTRLREVIATSPYIDDSTIQKLLRFRDKKIDFYLAANSAVPLSVLQDLLERGMSDIDEALASNMAIDDTLFEKLLKRDESAQQILLAYQSIDNKRMEMIEQRGLSVELYIILGQNQNLSESVIEKLLTQDNPKIIELLSANPSLSHKLLEELFHREHSDIDRALSCNTSTPAYILEAIYSKYPKESAVMQNIAGNCSTPTEILIQLFELDTYEINEKLAANPSLPLKLLNILKIDTRLRNALTSNKSFTDNITKNLGL